MSKGQRIFLKQRVIPTIILFGLLPRSVFYTSTLSITAYILTGVFAFLSLAYLLIRCIAVIKYIDYKGIISIAMGGSKVNRKICYKKLDEDDILEILIEHF